MIGPGVYLHYKGGYCLVLGTGRLYTRPDGSQYVAGLYFDALLDGSGKHVDVYGYKEPTKAYPHADVVVYVPLYIVDGYQRLAVRTVEDFEAEVEGYGPRFRWVYPGSPPLLPWVGHTGDPEEGAELVYASSAVKAREAVARHLLEPLESVEVEPLSESYDVHAPGNAVDGQVEKDPHVLRLAGFAEEPGDTRCSCCGRASMGTSEGAICAECEQCAECGHADGCPGGLP